MNNDIYRLSWEMVDSHELWRFCNANPSFYKNTTQTVPNSLIPDQYWRPVSKETVNPWQQALKLKEWSDADKEFIRNVKLEKMVSKPSWEEVEIHAEGQSST